MMKWDKVKKSIMRKSKMRRMNIKRKKKQGK